MEGRSGSQNSTKAIAQPGWPLGFAARDCYAKGKCVKRATELIGIDPDKSFSKKLEQLHKEGQIGTTEKEYLEVLTDAGSAAAHRGWEPDAEQLRVLTSIMEHFVSRFILKEEAGKLKGSIPPRQKQRSGEVRIQSENLIEFPVSKTSNDPPTPDRK
jgi:hypothetical protein